MSDITLTFRDLSPAELSRMRAGFDEHTLEMGAAVQTADRFGFVAMDGDKFVGCSSGLAYENGAEYSGWFYLTDLFVEAQYRKRGIGASLLLRLEREVFRRGVRHVYTWTAGYEAPGFYHRQGYTTFAELEHWYSDGSSRVALRKTLF
ncbi:GNAT family N-acetyltransferase [Lewinella sp. W8]|uniref:GNAT family N-acetyltransferase n=1 Tax=Lewinella sp. W8 TaxID=2528208 RepID=UPI001068D22D|nr:GNAT family N-acetyltransferase [Lewinella sp. W8]MTB51160.1 GNAT family N-acetyltransferase [Lewinella sp. W8]